jgi:hypothetical protein
MAYVFGMRGPFADPFEVMQRPQYWGSDPDGGRHFCNAFFDRWFLDRGGYIQSYTPLPYSGKLAFTPEAWQRRITDVGLSPAEFAPYHWRELQYYRDTVAGHPNYSEVEGVPGPDVLVRYLGSGAVVRHVLLDRGVFTHTRLALGVEYSPNEPPYIENYDPWPGRGISLDAAPGYDRSAYTPQLGIEAFWPPQARVQ